jgi:hypothetical protein
MTEMTPEEYLEEISELPIPPGQIYDLDEFFIDDHTFYTRKH